MDLKILICGSRGFLGMAFQRAFPRAIAGTFDIADAEQVGAALRALRPDVVINCAGKTGRPNVDWCETHRSVTTRSNVVGPRVLMRECLRRRARLVHISSGCVYQGDNGGSGFREEDPPNFRDSFYSRSKLAAEQFLRRRPVLILRLRMPFDDSPHQRNLIQRVAKYDRVLDAQNSITYLPDFLRAARRLIEQRETGLFHVVNQGTISPFEIMQRYQRLVDPAHRFTRLSPRELGEITLAPRSNCRLSIEKLQRRGIRMREVGEAVGQALRAAGGPWRRTG